MRCEILCGPRGRFFAKDRPHCCPSVSGSKHYFHRRHLKSSQVPSLHIAFTINSIQQFPSQRNRDISRS
jgi:hypothetical protein